MELFFVILFFEIDDYQSGDFDNGSVVTDPFSQEHGGLLLPSCQTDA